MKRSLSKVIRFEVFKRDSFSCQYCGQKPPVVILEIDHIHPISLGGDNSQANLITACFDCNRGKSARLLNQVIDPISSQMEKEKERIKQLKEYNTFLISKRKKIDKAIEDVGIYWFNIFKDEKDKYCFGESRIPSIKKFLETLPVEKIKEAMDIAHLRIDLEDDGSDFHIWKYFCGVCWGMIKGRKR